jgi:HPt (histidine-containing phosphotransfer) domain-containing protein
MNDPLSNTRQPHLPASIPEQRLFRDEPTPAGGGAPAATPEHLRIFHEEELLNRVLNDRGIAQTVLAVFLEDIPKQLESLKGAQFQGEVFSVQKKAHTIKGAAATVAAGTLSHLAAAMEAACEANRPEQVPALIGIFEKEFLIFATIIEERGWR